MALVIATYTVEGYFMSRVELNVDEKTRLTELTSIISEIGNAINRLTVEELTVRVELNFRTSV